MLKIEINRSNASLDSYQNLVYSKPVRIDNDKENFIINTTVPHGLKTGDVVLMKNIINNDTFKELVNVYVPDGILNDLSTIFTIPYQEFYELKVDSRIGEDVKDILKANHFFIKIQFKVPHFFYRATNRNIKIKAYLFDYSKHEDLNKLNIGDYIVYNNYFLYRVNNKVNNVVTFSNILNGTCDINININGQEQTVKCYIPVTTDGIDNGYSLLWEINDASLKEKLLNNGIYPNVYRKNNRFINFLTKPTLINTVELYKLKVSYTLNIPMTEDFASNIHQTDIVQQDFIEKEINKIIPPIVNMEKVVFEPRYIESKFKEDTLYQGDKLKPIYSMKFNLHFRERFIFKEENGKYIKTDEIDENWNPQEGGYWNGYYIDDTLKALKPVDNYTYGSYQSDLLGYLNFTNDDVKYQKSKLQKSFIRLSFYDSRDIKIQKLLFYSTMFLDTGEIYGKYAKNVNNKSYVNLSDRTLKLPKVELTGAGVFSEYSIEFNEDKRLSTQFSITDKYDEDKSSEGFYIYLFQDTAPKLEPQSIFMKVEFNHAGYGKTLPFMLPVDENYEPIDIISPDFPYDGFTKEISANNTTIKGNNMQEYYKALFIELKLVYDEVSNSYVYFLPRGIVSNDKNVLEFNLYESKI